MLFGGDGRGGRDRRQIDLGPPPGVRDRRSGDDRRQGIFVNEIELSDDEWKAYFPTVRFDSA